MVDFGNEFGKNKTFGRFFEVFPKRPPTVIIHRPNHRIGTIEKGDVLRKPVKRLVIGNVVCHRFIVDGVKICDIFLELVGG